MQSTDNIKQTLRRDVFIIILVNIIRKKKGGPIPRINLYYYTFGISGLWLQRATGLLLSSWVTYC